MTDFCLCKNDKCENSNICKRFLTKESQLNNPVYIRFENLCKENNNYVWLMETNQVFVKERGDT